MKTAASCYQLVVSQYSQVQRNKVEETVSLAWHLIKKLLAETNSYMARRLVQSFQYQKKACLFNIDTLAALMTHATL